VVEAGPSDVRSTGRADHHAGRILPLHVAPRDGGCERRKPVEARRCVGAAGSRRPGGCVACLVQRPELRERLAVGRDRRQGARGGGAPRCAPVRRGPHLVAGKAAARIGRPPGGDADGGHRLPGRGSARGDRCAGRDGVDNPSDGGDLLRPAASLHLDTEPVPAVREANVGLPALAPGEALSVQRAQGVPHLPARLPAERRARRRGGGVGPRRDRHAQGACGNCLAGRGSGGDCDENDDEGDPPAGRRPPETSKRGGGHEPGSCEGAGWYRQHGPTPE
jgi:hypothetical protein